MPNSNIIPPNEQNIADTLLQIRSELSALKKNRASYIKSTDIAPIHERLIQQIRAINAIRADPSLQHEQNKVDIILDDVFRLLSLAFLTAGLNRSAPATFASLSAVQSLLDHLKESQVYSDNDTAPIRTRLDEIKVILAEQEEAGTESPEILHLLKTKLDVASHSLKEVEDSMKAVFDSGLNDMLRRLVALRREILSIGSKPRYSASSLTPVSAKLAQIEAERDDEGNFVASDGKVNPEAQAVLNSLLDECRNLIKEFSGAVTARSSNDMPEQLRPFYKKLVELKSKLENLLVTHRWTMRETDLYAYQKSLEEIDTARTSDPELAALAKENHKASAIILYLLRRCYAILYKLLESSQPVSEALIPVHNQLSTVRRCLLEVQRNGGLSSARELYPYQMKLASIDDMRVDGKFMVGDTIPEGQGMLNALLSECFEICYELKVEMMDRNESGTNEEDNSIQFTEGAEDREEEICEGDDDEEAVEEDDEGVEITREPSSRD
ncbi:uncharacterized protein SAPINGB_P006248 [Magnusiomyces paraingens]|uniref:Uncharacterized protein n=1 Tax=Magnusiomyces paraingens TaxID=2606893 RepID=A0A5E8CB34_9ASCO|nr:uncharacterized protein SAPINGB_P006248 [Saprochaete ingens]VVT58516.1 unnamed protein product [Saprochaete ingens]